MSFLPHSDFLLIGYFAEIVDMLNEEGILNISIVDNLNPYDSRCNYLGSDNNNLPFKTEFFQNYTILFVPDAPATRKNLVAKYEISNKLRSGYISKNALIRYSSEIHHGVVIAHGCHVSSGVLLESYVKLNVNSTIMHDSKIGQYTTVAPCATILGKVNIGRECYIGAGAIILPGLHIGDNVVVGAGAVVTKSIPSHTTVVGVPAKALNK